MRAFCGKIFDFFEKKFQKFFENFSKKSKILPQNARIMRA